MNPAAGKDYSFLLQAPEQLREIFARWRQPDGRGLTLTHPVVPMPTAEWVVQTLAKADGERLMAEAMGRREKLIRDMAEDPYRWGYELQSWKDADELLKAKRSILITGPNRASKTEYAAKRVVKTLMTRERAIVWCLTGSNEMSIRGGGQQEAVWKYLPPEVKAYNHKRSGDRRIGYTENTRFADNMFIVPQTGSECRFMNLEQKITVIEGGQIDLFWLNEAIAEDSIKWVTTLLGRLVDRGGKGIVDFTPIYGWNEAYAFYVQGGTVRLAQDFPLFREVKHWPGLKPGQIPYIIDKDEDHAAIFFRPNQNPFVSWDALVKLWSNSSMEVQMLRLAGLALKKVGNRFPKFTRGVHVIPADRVPKNGTDYHIMDFAWERNWAQIWVRVCRVGDRKRYFVWKDWPDKRTFGEWAVRTGKVNGERGQAQTAVGLSVSGYVELVRDIERTAGVTVFQRFGDPRSGKAPAITRDAGGECLIDMLSLQDFEVEPARGLLIGEGVNLINELFDWNEDQPLSAMNEPRLFISEECQQVIDCLTLWTGQGSEKEQASKDFIDLLRYMATADLDDVGAVDMESYGGGSY